MNSLLSVQKPLLILFAVVLLLVLWLHWNKDVFFPGLCLCAYVSQLAFSCMVVTLLSCFFCPAATARSYRTPARSEHQCHATAAATDLDSGWTGSASKRSGQYGFANFLAFWSMTGMMRICKNLGMTSLDAGHTVLFECIQIQRDDLLLTSFVARCVLGVGKKSW